jgi:hypothetical protein
MRIAAWAQVLAGVLVAAMLGYLGLRFIKRIRRKPANAA